MKLTPEKLEEELLVAGDRAPYAIRLIRAHIAALEAELARLTPSGQVAEDRALLNGLISDAEKATGNKEHDARAALTRLAADAQTLQNLRAHRWKCHCGRPVNLAAIIDAVKENPT